MHIGRGAAQPLRAPATAGHVESGKRLGPSFLHLLRIITKHSYYMGGYVPPHLRNAGAAAPQAGTPRSLEALASGSIDLSKYAA